MCAVPRDLFTLPPPADLYLLASVLQRGTMTTRTRIRCRLAAAPPRTPACDLRDAVAWDATPHRAKMSDVLMRLMFTAPVNEPWPLPRVAGGHRAGGWSEFVVIPCR